MQKRSKKNIAAGILFILSAIFVVIKCVSGAMPFFVFYGLPLILSLIIFAICSFTRLKIALPMIASVLLFIPVGFYAYFMLRWDFLMIDSLFILHLIASVIAVVILIVGTAVLGFSKRENKAMSIILSVDAFLIPILVFDIFAMFRSKYGMYYSTKVKFYNGYAIGSSESVIIKCRLYFLSLVMYYAQLHFLCSHNGWAKQL